MTGSYDNIVFAVTKDVLQEAAKKRIGRELDDQEMYSAKKGIEAGLTFDIETVFTAAIEDATKGINLIL